MEDTVEKFLNSSTRNAKKNRSTVRLVKEENPLITTFGKSCSLEDIAQWCEEMHACKNDNYLLKRES